MEFFSNMDNLLQTFWYVALPVSLVFIIMTIMTFVGLDAHDGADADFDGDMHGGDTPFQLFSLRNLINFLLGFSWTGISFYSTIENHVLLILLSLGVGSLFVYLFFLVLRQMQKLSEDNSFRYTDTIGKTAEVYLNIPEKRSGHGKVLVSVKGSMRELTAISESEKFPSGTMVKIVRVENGDVLIVEKL